MRAPFCVGMWLAWLLLSGCRPGERSAHEAAPDGPADSTNDASAAAASDDAAADRSRLAVSNDAGITCHSVKDCSAGSACLFEHAGCQQSGRCIAANAMPMRRCNVAIPMCGCESHLTLWGPGGCMGNAPEPWEQFACTCQSDADCRGGQICGPTRSYRTDGAKNECQSPKEKP